MVPFKHVMLIYLIALAASVDLKSTKFRILLKEAMCLNLRLQIYLEMPDCILHRLLSQAAFKVEMEHVLELPANVWIFRCWLFLEGPRFYLGQVDVPQSKDRQAVEQKTWFLLKGQDQGSLELLNWVSCHLQTVATFKQNPLSEP